MSRGSDPRCAGWRKDICKRHLSAAMATHSGGRSKTAENQVGREKHRPSLAIACQPRPSLALLYLPTESVDNPVYETWQSGCIPRQYWAARTVQKIPEINCSYKNQIVMRGRTKRCRGGCGIKREASPRDAACALKLAEESTKVDNLHRDGEEIGSPDWT